MTYIQGGNYLKTQTDASGAITTFYYDNNDNPQKGLVVKVKDPNNNETTYTYNANTDEILSTAGKSNTSTSVSTSFTSQDYLPKTVVRNGTTYTYDYDNQNRVTAAKVGTQTLVTNSYDTRRRLSQQTFANGTTYQPVYDGRDRTVGEKWNGTQIVKYSYNENDRLSQMVDSTGSSPITYKYDYAFLGLMNKITGSDGTQTLYDYDMSGALVDLKFKKNNEIIHEARYHRNEKGNQEDNILTSLGTTAQHFNYDGFGRLTGQSAGPLVSLLEYAETTTTTSNQVSELTNENSDASLQEYAYGYDLNGNITEITEAVADTTTSYTYDGLNRLVSEAGPAGFYAYNYDVGGNLTSVTQGGTAVHNYTYGNTNWKDRLTALDGTAITYDANGNPLTFGGYTFTWQRGRQLASFSGNGLNITYTYDASGNRTKQVANGTTINYLYAGNLLMRQSDGTNALDFAYDANGKAVGFKYNGAPYLYVRNLQGDVVAITDADGDVVGSYTYDAYGNITAYSGAMASINPIRYRGYYQDPHTGWYFLQTRYYNPDWRRFLNSDALFIAGNDSISGSNMYAYCNGNPVMYSDPSGMGPITDWIKDNAIRLASKAISVVLIPETLAFFAVANWVVLPALQEQLGDDPMATLGLPPMLSWGANTILPIVPSSWKLNPWMEPTGLRHFMPVNMALGAPWAAYFLGFEPAKAGGITVFGKKRLQHTVYRTIEAKPMWQSQVGYDPLYDLAFSLGGPIERLMYKFKLDAISYVIWCWKGDYWNLGAGAEIGIYYNENEDAANNGYYKISTDLTVHTRMLIKYRPLGLVPFTLDDFHQTNWWVTSFTNAVQMPDVDKIEVDLDVRFTSYVSDATADPVVVTKNGNLDHLKLLKPFYDERQSLIGTERSWTEISMLPYANKSRPTGHSGGIHQCGKRPEFCTCTCTTSGCGNPCAQYTLKCVSGDPECEHVSDVGNGFQFHISY
jgi:RHS repeat-associated protein